MMMIRDSIPMNEKNKKKIFTCTFFNKKPLHVHWDVEKEIYIYILSNSREVPLTLQVEVLACSKTKICLKGQVRSHFSKQGK